MRILWLMTILIVANIALGDRVRVEVVVTGGGNSPVEGAEVTFRTRKARQAPFWAAAEKEDYVVRTDSKGAAVENFNCWSGRFECYVSAEGYYSEELPPQVLRSESVDPFSMRLLETDRRIAVELKPKVNPIPLYSYAAPRTWPYFGTNCWVDCGYDLKKHDWLPPKGKGEVADFYVSNRAELEAGCLVSNAELLFPDGGGGYILSHIGGDSCWIVYSANTNALFCSRFEASRTAVLDGAVSKERQLLKENQCLVIRTRVKKDAEGNIVSCNYAKIYGPFNVAGEFRFSQSSFNPTENDANLEFDTSRNLVRRQAGKFRP